jgi:hypothetical protein
MMTASNSMLSSLPAPNAVTKPKASAQALPASNVASPSCANNAQMKKKTSMTKNKPPHFMDDQQISILFSHLSDITGELSCIADSLDSINASLDTILEKGIKRDPLP